MLDVKSIMPRQNFDHNSSDILPIYFLQIFLRFIWRQRERVLTWWLTVSILEVTDWYKGILFIGDGRNGSGPLDLVRNTRICKYKLYLTSSYTGGKINKTSEAFINIQWSLKIDYHLPILRGHGSALCSKCHWMRCRTFVREGYSKFLFHYIW